MQFILILVLAGLILLFIQAGMALPATIVFLLLVVDITLGYVSKFLSFLWALLGGILDTGKAEFDELEKTGTKAPQGKKFLEDSLSRTGKALGKGEAAKAQGKHVADKRPSGESIHTAISDFMNGIMKLMKK